MKWLLEVEKKEQKVDGSVETKLWSGASLKREYELVSPDGQLFQGKGVRTLCRKFILSESAISQVLNGKIKHYKGWRKNNDTI